MFSIICLSVFYYIITIIVTTVVDDVKYITVNYSWYVN